MTATIRTVTRRANGRETTRSVETPRNILSIGRSTECDIHLPDLRIGLRHARLTISDGAFLLEAEGDYEFKVGARIVRKLEARLGQPATAQFGPYTLKFGEAAGRLTIDVERVQQVAQLRNDPDRVFSLRRTWLSKRVGSWVLAATILALFLVFPAVTFAVRTADTTPVRLEAGQIWLSGALSSPHARLAGDCTACHETPFVSVRDDTCLSCHETVNHHADTARMTLARGELNTVEKGLRAVAATFDKPAGRCAECHMEHNGADGVAPATQASCTSCHAGLSTRLADARVGDASDFGNDHPAFHPTVVASADQGRAGTTHAWSTDQLDAARKAREALIPAPSAAASCDGFAVGQPNFRGLPRASAVPAEAAAGDNSGLVFPHDVHLAEGGCVSAIAERLPGDRYGEKLLCKDCHTLNPDGVGFAPVRMEENCSACHSLVFDNAGGFERELRHGRTNDVIATLLDFYQARIVGATLGGASGEDRRRPGEAGARAAGFREAAFAQASGRAATRVRAVFSEGGACYGCHVVTPPSQPGALDFKVAPVTLRDTFMPRAVFNHRAHEIGDLECADCHKAETSRTSADVLMPSVGQCRECHGGETALAKTQSSCVMCHGFHSTEPDAVRMGAPHPAREAAATPRRGLFR